MGNVLWHMGDVLYSEMWLPGTNQPVVVIEGSQLITVVSFVCCSRRRQ